ncbi:ribokinase [Brevibacillus sp. SYSU BS000544]|uniref:ribokinase n=1 Tax=Brevibacillus sp. SYSU BS000544 TaxID=3416443 RepID=UPI003CE48B74
MNQPNIAVIGSLNMDIVIEANRLPALGETLMGKQAHFIPGGKGANQAVATARLGARTAMIGAVGGDGFGKELLHALSQDQVNTDAVKTVDGTATGIASIMLAENDNCIVVVAGANATCSPEDIDRHLDKVEAADVVLLQLEIPIETVVYAAKKAKELGKQVILNPAPARELPEQLYACIDVITPNQSELGYLSGLAVDETNVADAMRVLASKGVRQVVTTLGANGSAILTDDNQFERIAGYKVDVVDTTGAGDSYNAGLAYALATKQDLKQAVEFASKVAALAVTKLGAQAGMPTMEQVKQFRNE